MATTWTVQSESDESGDWTTDDLASQNTRAERDAWSLTPISANASGRDRAMGWGNWMAEDFHFLPEETDILPDEMQADREQWTVEPRID